MEVIKFESKEEWQKLCWQTIRHNVNNYFKENGISNKSNVNMVIKTFVLLFFYLFPLILILVFKLTVFTGVICAISMGLAKAGIGMSVMHDGLHGSYSSKKWLNSLMGSSMYIIGSNVLNWKIQHNIYHHAYTNIDGWDEDIQTRWILRFCEHTPLKKIHKYQHLYAFVLYTLMTFSMLFGDYTQLIGYQKAGILKKHKVNLRNELIKMSLIKITYLLMMLGLPIMYSGFTAWQVIAGFVLMHLIAGFIMTLIFQLAHVVEDTHQPLLNDKGITENEWAIHQLLTTANFARNNKLLNWYVGGLNFQIEHHLFPNICHIHYSKISPIVEKTAKEFGVHYNIQPTFRSAVNSHLKKLKELGMPKVAVD